MKDTYYNKLLYNEAKKDFLIDPLRSKKLIEDYIEEYPTDYSAQSFYAFILIILDEIEKAIQIINDIELESSLNPMYYKHDEKVLYLKESLVANKIRILAYFEKYKELLDYYNQNKNYVYNSKFDLIPIYCKCKLDTLNKHEKERAHNSYLFSQVLDYDEERFKNHIKKHLTDFNENEEVRSSFSENFPIDKVIEEIKKNIPSEQRLCFDPFTDSYFFKYNDCGRNSGFITDYFKLITIHNTDKLITVCPVKINENMPYTDLNYLNKDKEKVKTLSQIEKFNRRYRR